MPRFRKQPIEIDAIQFTGTTDNLVALSEFVTQRTLHFDPLRMTLVIETLEGNHIASEGDWIIKGIKGECYPCKPDIFEATYEAIEV